MSTRERQRLNVDDVKNLISCELKWANVKANQTMCVRLFETCASSEK